MTLHLTTAEWGRITAAGSGVLFRAGERTRCSKCQVVFDYYCPDCATIPPAEFVEAAAACEACDPKNWDGDPATIEHLHQYGVLREVSIAKTGHPCCHDGKRRVAVVVPCEWCCGDGWLMGEPDHYERGTDAWIQCDCNPNGDDPYESPGVTVGHVVVTWGPLVVGSFPMLIGEQVIRSGDELWHWPNTDVRPLAVDTPSGLQFTDPDIHPLPPDVDPQTLVGQFALGVEVVS